MMHDSLIRKDYNDSPYTTVPIYVKEKVFSARYGYLFDRIILLTRCFQCVGRKGADLFQALWSPSQIACEYWIGLGGKVLINTRFNSLKPKA